MSDETKPNANQEPVEPTKEEAAVPTSTIAQAQAKFENSDPATIADQLNLTEEQKEELKKMPKEKYDKFLSSAADNLRKAEMAEDAARLARKKARETENGAEKDKLLKEAEKQDKLAKEFGTLAQRAQSGLWQGGVGGAGIGAGIGMGIGAVVGTLLGSIVAIPTTALGIAGGTAVGALHGPWATIGKKKKDGDDKDEEKKEDDKAKEGEEKEEDKKDDEATSEGEAATEAEKKGDEKVEEEAENTNAVPKSYIESAVRGFQTFVGLSDEKAQGS